MSVLRHSTILESYSQQNKVMASSRRRDNENLHRGKKNFDRANKKSDRGISYLERAAGMPILSLKNSIGAF
jgi:hypothetical protein